MAISKVIYKSSASATPETWMDATTATAAAADIISPKTAMLADGVMTTGTGSVGYTANDWGDRTKPVGEVSCDVAIAYDGNRSKYSSLLQNRTGITKASLPNATYIPDSYCQGCTGLTSFYAPLATATGGNCFYGCNSLEYAVLPSFEWNGSSSFYYCNNMLAADLGPNASSMSTYFFRDCAKMATLILRGSSICSLNHTTVFNNTPFASGKAGGTIYIPESLYNHLGDNSASDYKAASNWSTIDGYGTITWAKIEGSYYETHYADGTTIPTT